MFKITVYFNTGVPAAFYLSEYFPILEIGGFLTIHQSDRDAVFLIDDVVSFTVQPFGV